MTMKNNIFALSALGLVFAVGASAAAPAFAQVATTITTQTSVSQATSSPITSNDHLILNCSVPSANLWFGKSDSATSRDVYALQNFLFREGYLSSYSSLTGHFGPLTLSAVKKFQKAHGITPTGYMGALTRAQIVHLSLDNCNLGAGMGNGNGTGTTTATSTAVITALSPTQGAVGSTVTITGSGFTDSNVVLMNGDVAGLNVAPVNGTLTFTVPTSMGPYCKIGYACPMMAILVTKGTYNVTVLNANGTSNTIPFTVTSAPSLMGQQ